MKSSAPLFSVIAPIVSAYNVGLYRGTNCNSEPLGTVTDVRFSGNCYTNGVGTAQSAIVTEDGQDPEGTSVVFFSDANCTLGQKVASTDTGCISLSPYNNHGSFIVIGGGSKRRAINEAQVARRQSQGSKLYHGALTEIDGKAFRYEQLHEHAFRAVPIEEWDSFLRIANMEKLEFNATYPVNWEAERTVGGPPQRNFGTEKDGLQTSSNDLVEEKLLYSQCRLIRNCIEGVTGGDLSGLADTNSYIWNAIVAANKGSRAIIDFLKSQFVYDFAMNSAESISAAIIDAVQGGKESECSSQKVEAGTFQSAVQEAIAKRVANAANLEVTYNADGSLATLKIGSFPAQFDDNGQVCNVPATDPTTRGTRKGIAGR